VSSFNADGKQYGPGIVVFHADNVAYRSKNMSYSGDSNANDIIVPWSKIPANQIKSFIAGSARRYAFCGKSETNEAKASSSLMRRLLKDDKRQAENRRRSAEAWLLAAYFSSWYGQQNETLEYLENALEQTDNRAELEKEIRQHFLN